jgi:hypothetical protein
MIGSAGRQEDARYVTIDLYRSMYREARNAVREWQAIRAVSGGAAFADHLAVSAFLYGEVKELLLFLPAPFRNGRYVEGTRDHDPGRTSNRLHRRFKEITGIDGLAEIAEAERRGAVLHVIPGFQNRNLEVASAATCMIAFTFGRATFRNIAPQQAEFNDPRAAGLKISKGTAHTWGEAWKCTTKTHVNLNELADA